MSFIFGKRSRKNFIGVHSDLVMVSTVALSLSDVDFSNVEGARSLERQEYLMESGASRLRDPKHSRHILDGSGTCYAIDVAPWVAGQIRWDWELYHSIAEAFALASHKTGIVVEWGGCWAPLRAGVSAQEQIDDYVTRRKRVGKKPFLDGPHFQLPRNIYPRQEKLHAI